MFDWLKKQISPDAPPRTSDAFLSDLLRELGKRDWQLCTSQPLLSAHGTDTVLSKGETRLVIKSTFGGGYFGHGAPGVDLLMLGVMMNNAKRVKDVNSEIPLVFVLLTDSQIPADSVIRLYRAGILTLDGVWDDPDGVAERLLRLIQPEVTQVPVLSRETAEAIVDALSAICPEPVESTQTSNREGE